MITGRRFAAIDIGSHAVRLLLSEVFETDNGPYFSKGKTVSHSFGIGTIRLLEDLVHKPQWKDMKSWVSDHTRHLESIDAVGRGGNINKQVPEPSKKKTAPVSKRPRPLAN